MITRTRIKPVARTWLWILAAAAAMLSVPAATNAQVLIARYREAFTAHKAADATWQFLYNAPPSDPALASPSGITDPRSYQPLEKHGDAYTGPSGLRLSATGGHPGATSPPQYAIAALQLPREGYYAIRQSALHKPGHDGDPINLLVHANGYRPVLHKTCPPGQNVEFNTDLGYLPANSTIYVAVGPGSKPESDEFELDFAVVRTDTPSLQSQVDRAQANHLAHLQLVPGRYYATAPLHLEHWAGFDLDAASVTLIAPPKITALSIRSCQHGRLAGLTIDQDPLPLTQGQVTSIDPKRSSLDLKIDDFFPIPPSGRPAGDRNMIFDRATLDQKQPATGFNIAGIQHLPASHCRLTFKHPLTAEVAPGDLLSIQASAGPAAVVIDDSEHMLLDSITLHSSAAFSFHEIGGAGNVYQHLKLTPGPSHLLASRPRLRSAGADGFHSSGSRIGPKVTDCLFERMGDDGLAIEGSWGVVVKDSSASEALVAVRRDDLFRPAIPLRFFRFATRDQARANVASCKRDDGNVDAARAVIRDRFPAFGNWKDYKYVYAVTLAGMDNPNLKPGDLVSFPDANGQGFEFRHNTIRGGRSRGIIVKANGTVDGNTIEACQKPGILVYSAFGHDSMEAQFVEDLTISNNTIDNCDFMHPAQNSVRYCGGIVINADVARDQTPWGADGHHNIRIENNTLRRIYRGVNLAITDASNVLVKDNQFLETHEHPGGGGADFGVNNQAVIWVGNADHVTIQGCRIRSLGPYADPHALLSTTPNSRHVTGTLFPPVDRAPASPGPPSATPAPTTRPTPFSPRVNPPM